MTAIYTVLLGEAYGFDKLKGDNKIYFNVLRVGIGFQSLAYKLSEWPLLFMTQACLMIQLIMHIPFIYYIGKENFLMAYDEYYY